MSLKVKIQEDLKTALKEHRDLEVATLRMLLAFIGNKEKEKRAELTKAKGLNEAPLDSGYLTEQAELVKQSQLTDQETIEVVSSEIKKRREAISGFEKGERFELAEKEKKEMEILKKYLPEQLSEEEIKKLSQEVIKEIGAISIKDMGRVMAALMPRIKGKAEGGTVSRIVKELLSS